MVKNLIRALLYTAIVCKLISILIPYTIIDPELVKYDQEFQEYLNTYCPSKKYIKPVQKVIYFDDLNPGAMALCSTNKTTKFTIVYDRNVWDNITEDQRFSTAMHESVHCYFGIGHTEDTKHFMYREENYLSKAVVEEQLITLIKEQCK